MVALSILLGGGSLVCLSRGSWAQNDQIQEGNSADDLVTEVEPENHPLFEPVPPSEGLNRGTFSLSESFLKQINICLKMSVWQPSILVW